MRAGVIEDAVLRTEPSDYELACRKLARYLPVDVFIDFMHTVNEMSENINNSTNESTSPMPVFNGVDHRRGYYEL